jgi:hypothetical protein
VAEACRTIGPLDAMSIVRLDGDQVHAVGAAGLSRLQRAAGQSLAARRLFATLGRRRSVPGAHRVLRPRSLALVHEDLARQRLSGARSRHAKVMHFVRDSNTVTVTCSIGGDVYTCLVCSD